MCKIELNATQVAAIYKGGNEESRKILKETLGSDFSTVLPVTDRVKTFDDATSELGEQHPLVIVYNYLKYGYRNDVVRDNLFAFCQLSIIAEALNEGWSPTKGEQRWYPHFEHTEENELPENSATISFSYSEVSTSDSFSIPAQLAFKSEELATYSGITFVDIYDKFISYQLDSKEDATNI